MVNTRPNKTYLIEVVTMTSLTIKDTKEGNLLYGLDPILTIFWKVPDKRHVDRLTNHKPSRPCMLAGLTVVASSACSLPFVRVCEPIVASERLCPRP